MSAFSRRIFQTFCRAQPHLVTQKGKVNITASIHGILLPDLISTVLKHGALYVNLILSPTTRAGLNFIHSDSCRWPPGDGPLQYVMTYTQLCCYLC